MIVITDGVNTYKVSRGAFDGIFSRQGFSEVANKEVKETEEAEPSDDEAFMKELEEKPIAQWNKDEVKKYAEFKGIDISGTRNVGEAKERIKEVMQKE